jgi:hypothetical protein
LPPGYVLAQWRALVLSALPSWRMSLTYHTGVSIAARGVVAGGFHVVIADFVALALAVGWAT